MSHNHGRQDDSEGSGAGFLLFLGLACIAFAIGFMSSWHNGLLAAGLELVFVSALVAAGKHSGR